MPQVNGAIPHVPVAPVRDSKGSAHRARQNLALGYPRFQDLPEVGKVKGSAIAIVGGGPSLAGKLDVLRSYRTVMACASVHDYLVEKGIALRYTVVLDPVAEGNLHYFNFPQETCTYLIASHVEPKVLDKFDGYPVALWNCMGEAGFAKGIQIMGGPTAALRGMVLALHMGWTDQHLFGMDSCYADGDSHAYPVSEPMPEDAEVTVAGERRFRTTKAWVAQAQWFFNTLEAVRVIRPTIHGDGMIAEMVRKGNPELHKYIRLA